MRKMMALVAVLSLVAAPAFAGLTPSSFSPVQTNLTQSGSHTVGVYGITGSGAPAIYTNASFYPTGSSGSQSLTFAFHWPYVTTMTGLQFHSQLVWDNNEIQILNISAPVGGPWAATPANNYPASSFWPVAPSAPNGSLAVGDVLGGGTPLWANPASTTTLVAGSGIYPFMKVNYQVRPGAHDNGAGALDLFIGQAALLFYNPAWGAGTWWTGGNIGATSYGINVLPEPASLSLLAIGFATTGVGVWRRRRR